MTFTAKSYTRRYLPLIAVVMVVITVVTFLLLRAKQMSFVKTPSVVITSPDGKLRLDVSPSVLPKGTKPQDIHIETIASSPNTAYHLTPEGLTFQTPVKFTLSAGFQNALPLVVLRNGEKSELVTSTSTVVDKNGLATVEGTLTHFSDLYLIDVDKLITLDVPKSYPSRKVNETLDHRYIITFPRTPVTQTIIFPGNRKIEDTIQIVDDVYVSGEFRTLNSLIPHQVQEAPRGQYIQKEGFFSYHHPFTCAAEGEDSIVTKVRLQYKVLFNGGGPFFEYPTAEHRSETSCQAESTKEKSSLTLPTCPGVTEDPKGKEVEMLLIGGSCYPKIQFRIADPDVCGAKHYHSDGPVKSLDGKTKTDPNPAACGYGRLTEVFIQTVKLSPEKAAEFLFVDTNSSE